MSGDPACSFEDAATMVHGLVPQPHGAEVVTLPEVVQGRLILRAYGVQVAAQGAPITLELFQGQRFELAEVAETLVLETQPRVYEEMVIRKDVVDRIETVKAVLRHEEAEVVVEDPAATSTDPTRSAPKA
jgi:stress response protein YsnF